MAVDALGLIAGAIGSALQAKGAKKAAALNTEGQQKAADYAMQGSMPWNVAGSLGGVKFDSEGKAIGLGLSEAFQAQQDAYLASADANRGYLAGLEGSPQDAAQRFYEQEMALVKPEQEIAREQLDAQLVSQGMLGSSGGAARAAALAQAQGNVRLQARQSASERVQNMIDQYRARISGDVGDAVSLGQQPLAYANLGAGVGGMLSEPAMLGSKYLSGAALTNANMMMGRYGSMGNSLKSFRSYQPYQSNQSKWGKTPSAMTAATGRTVDRHYSRNMI